MLTEHDIHRITARIAETYRPLVVGTFGSYAVGSPTSRSDLDLLVIKATCSGALVDARALRRLLFHVLHPLDVHVFTAAEFERSVYEYQSFTWVIARQAQLYHWAAEAAQAVPSLVPRTLVSFG